MRSLFIILCMFVSMFAWKSSGFFSTEKIETIPAQEFLIVCANNMDLDELKAELERNCVRTVQQNNDGKIYIKKVFQMFEFYIFFDVFHFIEFYKFKYADRDVYYCIHRMLMLPTIDLTNISYYFIYKLFANATDQPEIESMCKRFSQIIKTVSCNRFGCNSSLNDTKYIHSFVFFFVQDQLYLQPPNPVTIVFFCNVDDKIRINELARYFVNYQSAVRCRRFWSHVSTNNLVVAIKKHLRFWISSFIFVVFLCSVMSYCFRFEFM